MLRRSDYGDTIVFNDDLTRFELECRKFVFYDIEIYPDFDDNYNICACIDISYNNSKILLHPGDYIRVVNGKIIGFWDGNREMNVI